MTNFETLLDRQLLAVVEAVQRFNVVVDDHRPATARPVEGVLLVQTGMGTFVCPIFRREWTSLNQLYIGRDGRVHLSTRSVSGTLQGFPRHADFRLDTLESIKEFYRGNDNILDVLWLDVPQAEAAA